MDVHSYGWACTDCIMLLANGETPPDLSEAETATWLADIERHTEGLDVVCGGEHEDFCENVLWKCADCGIALPDKERANGDDAACLATGHSWHVPVYDTWEGSTDCECETQDFSHSSCDVCGTHLGGSRHAVTFFARNEVSR